MDVNFISSVCGHAKEGKYQGASNFQNLHRSGDPGDRGAFFLVWPPLSKFLTFCTTCDRFFCKKGRNTHTWCPPPLCQRQNFSPYPPEIHAFSRIWGEGGGAVLKNANPTNQPLLPPPTTEYSKYWLGPTRYSCDEPEHSSSYFSRLSKSGAGGLLFLWIDIYGGKGWGGSPPSCLMGPRGAVPKRKRRFSFGRVSVSYPVYLNLKKMTSPPRLQERPKVFFPLYSQAWHGPWQNGSI